MKQFFPMKKGELILLACLISYVIFAFLPVWRILEVGGMAVFGWLMALLMLVAPVAALLIFRQTEAKPETPTASDTSNSSGLADQINKSAS